MWAEGVKLYSANFNVGAQDFRKGIYCLIKV